MSLGQTILPYIISGISVGGQYSLIAIGYTMVYGILRLINFAHGDVFMVAGLMMVYLAAALPLYIAIPLVILFTVLLGFTIERVAYKPLRSAPRMSVNLAFSIGCLPLRFTTVPFTPPEKSWAERPSAESSSTKTGISFLILSLNYNIRGIVVGIAAHKSSVGECTEGSSFVLAGLVGHERLGEDAAVVFALYDGLDLP